MKKGVLILGLAGLIILIAGFVLIGFSTTIGIALANAYLAKVVSLDGGTFLAITESYIASVRTMGFVISLFGGSEILIALSLMLKEKK